MLTKIFSTRYSIVFSGSRDSHDIYKWVATKRNLGTAGLGLSLMLWRLRFREAACSDEAPKWCWSGSDVLFRFEGGEY